MLHIKSSRASHSLLGGSGHAVKGRTSNLLSWALGEVGRQVSYILDGCLEIMLDTYMHASRYPSW